MARIRTIKPEAFASESLAAVGLSAERTFYGLLTQADDAGRFRDQPAVIAGLLWALRPEHGALGVEEDLAQLATADLICRYEGGDEKRYLHVVTWKKHQKITRPSGIRTPACPHHDGPQPDAPARRARGGVTETAASPRRGLSEDARHMRESLASHESAGQVDSSEFSVQSQGGLAEGSVSPPCPDLGPRIMDLGSVPSGGGSAPAPDTVLAQQLIGEYVAACAHRPPGDVLGRLGKVTAKLVDEGIDPIHIRAGLDRLRIKGMHPSVLPSLVNEAMNATPGAPRPGAHRPWTNPTDVAAAYGGDL